MRKVPLVIHLVKQESHRAGVGNHEADGAAQAVDKEQEQDWRVLESRDHLQLIHIPPRVGDGERARWVVEGGQEQTGATSVPAASAHAGSGEMEAGSGRAERVL